MTHAELEKAFREAKEDLEAEKRKTLYKLEREQKNIEQLHHERNSLKLEIQRLQQLLGERGYDINLKVSLRLHVGSLNGTR